jgi:tannase
MRFSRVIAATAASFSVSRAASLADLCTTSYVRSSLPLNGTLLGIILDPDSVTAHPIYNASTAAANFFPAATYDYCNVTLSYSHEGRGDAVHLQYWFPASEKFQNRYLSTGGGGYAINSKTQSLPGGVMYGAVAGVTDGGR